MELTVCINLVLPGGHREDTIHQVKSLNETLLFINADSKVIQADGAGRWNKGRQMKTNKNQFKQEQTEEMKAANDCWAIFVIKQLQRGTMLDSLPSFNSFAVIVMVKEITCDLL